ncbi:MAG TPA: hypothetical protein VMB20_13465 [Candidatus Acidoferrum sp.]|nr:hypothetical protein [Candidatus Acidoferrum sp.]
MSSRRLFVCVVGPLLFVLAACTTTTTYVPYSNNSSTSPSPSASPGTLTFSIAVPGRSGTSNRHLRVRPFTSQQNVQAVLVITPQTGPAISPSPFPCTNVCTGSVQVSPGVVRVAITLQNASTGAALAQGSTALVIVAGQSNPVQLTLDGVVASVSVALAQSSLSAGSPGSTLAVVNALDADGNVITYGGNYIDDNGNAVLIGLTSSDSTITLSTTVVSSPNTIVTVSYSGSTSMGLATITPSIETGSVTGALTAATISVQPTLALVDTLPATPPPAEVIGASANGAILYVAVGGGGSGGTVNTTTFALTSGFLSDGAFIPWRVPLTSDGHYNAPEYLGTPSEGYVYNEVGTQTPVCGTTFPAFADLSANIVYCIPGGLMFSGGLLVGAQAISGTGATAFNAATDVTEFGATPYVLDDGVLTAYNGAAPSGSTIAYGTRSTCDSNYYIVAPGTDGGSVLEAVPVSASGPSGSAVTLESLPASVGMPSLSVQVISAQVGGTCALVEIGDLQVVRLVPSAESYVSSGKLTALIDTFTTPVDVPDILFSAGGVLYVAEGPYIYRVNL